MAYGKKPTGMKKGGGVKKMMTGGQAKTMAREARPGSGAARMKGTPTARVARQAENDDARQLAQVANRRTSARGMEPTARGVGAAIKGGKYRI